MTPKEFVASYFEAAWRAYEKYGIHPVATLAQAAKESGWGNSLNATKAKNFFGITKGSAVANEYWSGMWRTTSDGRKFRVYPSPTNSFLDFGRLIANNYPDSASVSDNIEAYARTIAGSKYITDADNRSLYYSNLKSIGSKIESWVSELMAAKESPAEEKKGISFPDGSLPALSEVLPFEGVQLGGETFPDRSGSEVNFFTILIIVIVICVPLGWLALVKLRK